jgi:hypothetical protein
MAKPNYSFEKRRKELEKKSKKEEKKRRKLEHGEQSLSDQAPATEESSLPSSQQ